MTGTQSDPAGGAAVPTGRVMGLWQQWEEVGMVWEAPQSQEQNWETCQELASTQTTKDAQSKVRSCRAA